MFPVYPMICLAGAIAVDTVQKLYFYVRTKLNPSHIGCHYLQYTAHITILAMLICGLLGLSRSLAIYKGTLLHEPLFLLMQFIYEITIAPFTRRIAGYYAPMEVMSEANKLVMEGEVPGDVNVNFCVGKEWHRFPNSFFFPSNK